MQYAPGKQLSHPTRAAPRTNFGAIEWPVQELTPLPSLQSPATLAQPSLTEFTENGDNDNDIGVWPSAIELDALGAALAGLEARTRWPPARWTVPARCGWPSFWAYEEEW